MGFPPSSQATVFYAYTIRVNGIEVGHIQGLRSSLSRQITTYRGIDSDPNDLERDTVLIPHHTDIMLNVDRLETYSQNLLEALGQSNGLRSILSAAVPFEVHEELEAPRLQNILELFQGGLSPLASNAGRNILEGILQRTDSPERVPTRLGLTVVYQNCLVQDYSKSINTGTISIAEGVVIKVTNIALMENSNNQNSTLTGLQNLVRNPLGRIF